MESDLILFDNLQEISGQANRLELKHIIIAKSFSSKDDIKRLREKINSLKPDFEIKICHLMEKTEGKELESYRNAADFVCMLGDSLKNVSFAASNKKFDFILLQFDKNPQMIIDKETIMNAKINGIQILLPISAILNSNAYNKAAIMQKYAAIIKICEKLGCEYSIVSGANCKEEMRNKEDLDGTKTLFKEK
ncbi:MAG: RNase P subunit p30 family protein [archaeon]